MRLIIETDNSDDFTFAIRAARWLEKQPESQKDAILSYGEQLCDWYVRRTKTGMSVRRITAQTTAEDKRP